MIKERSLTESSAVTLSGDIRSAFQQPYLVPPLSITGTPPCSPLGQQTRVNWDGKFLRVNGRRFWMKGVTYGTFAPNRSGEPYPESDVVQRDFEMMRAAGINAVRLYTPPSDSLADMAAQAGLYLLPDLCWGPRRCQLDSADDVEFMRGWLRGHARRLARHPAILMYSLGNETPPLVVRWYGRRRIENWLRELYEIAKEEAPDTLVTYVNHPPTEYLDLPFLDVMSWNVYLERQTEFRAYLSRLQMLAGDRPVLLAELGLDSRQHGDKAQAEFLTWQLRATFEAGFCGAAVYSWTDEWQIFGEEIGGWSFGLTDAARRPKRAFRSVQSSYSRAHCERSVHRLPAVSVVVCAYNAAVTLGECLASLMRLNYPDYEVIVVDDGSSDGTANLAESCGVCVLRAPHGGLSRARNLGIEAARGEVVAFIDADAYADADWLFFLVTRLEEQGAAGVGGPNLPPPQDGFTARCIHHSPGNPTHVLLSNEQAEHIPGCNMAFRKDVLQSIGAFDPIHNAAGDDVDVCWKLLARNQVIAFSPAALVWHHRRPSVRGYLRQQRGYGYAEAHLHHRYPGHYNLFGHAVWRGGIYDAMRPAALRTEVPFLLNSRIYQGRFGSAQFQCIYAAVPTHWLQVLLTVEWMVLLLSLVATAACLAGSRPGPSGTFWMALPAAGLAATLAVAWRTGSHAASLERWRGLRRWSGALLIMMLHVIQPIARAWGRLKGWWQLRGQPSPYRTDDRLYGNLTQREAWLHRFEALARNAGWLVRPSCEFSGSDLEIYGPGPVRASLQSVYEENLERGQHFIRYRVRAKWKSGGLVLLAGLSAGLVGSAWAHLWPLLLPLGLLTLVVARAPVIVATATAQLAVEAGEALDLPLVRKFE